jgi:hypothetical protein
VIIDDVSFQLAPRCIEKGTSNCGLSAAVYLLAACAQKAELSRTGSITELKLFVIDWMCRRLE